MEIINTCFETTKNYHSIAYYSHFVPAAIILLLSFFVLFQTKFSLISKIFCFFSVLLSLWLIGDVVLWTVSDYNIVSFAWAPLDYINVLFYLFGAYFFIVLIKGKDIDLLPKIGLFVLSLPAWFITVTNRSITLFDQTVCEAWNSTFLTNYKLGLELAVALFIIIFAIYHYRKSATDKRRQIVAITTGLIAFFVVFSLTEYISSLTGLYEINLYSLFILPLFLGLITYSITALKIFQLRTFGTQLLVYILLIMIGSQFFFLENTTDRTLTIVTFLLSLVFSYFLLRSTRREMEALAKIQVLAHDLEISNEKLKGLDKLKTEFLSLASHQLRSPLTAIKGYASMLVEGTYGKLQDNQMEGVKRIYSSAQGLVSIVEDLLNVSKIEQGGMKYELMPSALAPIVTALYNEMKIPAESKRLAFTLDIPNHDSFMAIVDPLKIKQVFLNLTDNSIKYTPSGFVKLSLSRRDDKILFSVADNGVGITAETKAKLFGKFSRGEGGKLNTGGSGLGLYLAQEITKAHKGQIVIESEGVGKGTTFIVELPAAGAHVTPDVLPS